MNLNSLLERLTEKGVHLAVDGDRIKVRAAKGALDADDRAALSSRKAELLRYLAARSVAEPLRPVDRSETVPLSFAQQRLWFLSCLGESDEAYRISLALRLEGALNQAALARAFTEIVRRHEILRTRIVADGEGAVQRIDPPPAAILSYEDLSGAPEAEASNRAAVFVAAPFDLAAGPLFRARLWRLAPQCHMLAVAVHHIVFDGWSLNVLMHELSARYTADAAGHASCLPDLAIQYADYAVWQREWLAGERIERQAAYWREQLAGAPVQSTVPSDRSRPAVATSRGDVVRCAVPSPVARGIRALARHAGATPFVPLLAAWGILLGRLSGQDDVVVGVPIANRSRLELEPLLGMFANTLALRLDLSGAPTLGDLLERARATTLAAYDCQDIPFDHVVDAVMPARQMHHHPLFQTVFVLQNAAAARGPLELPGLTVAPLSLEGRSAKFDLTLEVTESADGFDAQLEYNTDLYERSTAEGIVARWGLLLEAMAQPGAALQPLLALPLMEETERDLLIRGWGSNTRPYRRDHTIAAAFAEQAALYPHAIAVTSGDVSLTYRELDERANRLARHLLGFGHIGPDVLVGLALERSLDLVIALLAILKAGAAYMPLNPDDPAERLALMLGDDVPLVVTTRALAQRLPASNARLVLLDAEAEIVARQEGSASANGAGPTNLAYALYTSGSTGEPKGVLVEQRSVLRLVDNAGFAALGPDCVVLLLAPLSFDASTFEIWGPLLTGGRLVVMEAGTPTLAAIGATIRRHGVNTLWLTAGLFHAMVEERLEDLAPLRQLLAGGDILSPVHVARVLAAHPHVTLINGYGPTETTTFAVCHRMRAGEPLTGGVPIGRPIGNTHVYVRDRHGELVPPNVAGELFIGGDGVARSYRKRPAFSAERFVPDPWRPGERLYRTGDLVRWRRDGVLEFLGRQDNQIKIRGFRVEPGEVEAAISTHPDVAGAAVVVHTDTRGARHLAACVVRRTGSELKTADMSAWLKGRLPAYMLPQLWQLVPELPLTANGKLDRTKLPAPVMPTAPDTDAAPRTATERVLAEIWAKLLGRSAVGRHDNFFELGGDSILSLQIVARCRNAGLTLLPRQVFEHQTVAELAPHVAADDGAAQEAEQLPLTGPVAVSPIQKWFYALRLREPHHFNQSVMLNLAPEVDPEVLRRALSALIHHHDMLRLRVSHAHGTAPLQWIAPPGDDVPLSIVDATELAGDAEATSSLLERAQASLDLQRGPILRALFLPQLSGRGARLLLIIHHLAVDGVSWRILLEDLETACEAVLSGRTVALPRKTLAFQRWTEKLMAYADSEAAGRDLRYWQMMSENEDFEDVSAQARALNLVGTAHKVQRVLGAAFTRDLLQTSSRAYNTRVDDMLLAALALSYTRLSGNKRLRIDLEGHGRGSFDASLDLSRSVGWFTCLYPVDLILEGDGLKDAIIGIKEQLRRVPGNGLGYAIGSWLKPSLQLGLPGGSDIAFNYLGQFDQMLTGTPLIRVAEESSGPHQGAGNRRSHLIEILSLVFDGSLRMEWHYHPACHSLEQIETWADLYIDALTELVAHCTDAGAGGYTPADFPLVALGLAEIEDIQALAAASLRDGAA
jgi:amino acid adenylation domain-containing protein/non-ribosomal peptide synthase protein (TIGR01720 family)